jgi:hypothetical protein
MTPLGHYKNSFLHTLKMHSTLRIFEGLEVVGGVVDRELFTIVEGLFTKSCQTNGLLQNGGGHLKQWGDEK